MAGIELETLFPNTEISLSAWKKSFKESVARPAVVSEM